MDAKIKSSPKFSTVRIIEQDMTNHENKASNIARSVFSRKIRSLEK